MTTKEKKKENFRHQEFTSLKVKERKEGRKKGKRCTSTSKKKAYR
jgi:hypothetical protein